SADRKRNRWCLIASRDGRESSLLIHQDIALYASVLEQGFGLVHEMQDKRSAYVQVARGQISLNGDILLPGDAAKIDNVQKIALEALQDAELLLFDLPSVQDVGR